MEFQRDTLKFLIRLGNDFIFFPSHFAFYTSIFNLWNYLLQRYETNENKWAFYFINANYSFVKIKGNVK